MPVIKAPDYYEVTGEEPPKMPQVDEENISSASPAAKYTKVPCTILMQHVIYIANAVFTTVFFAENAVFRCKERLCLKRIDFRAYKALENDNIRVMQPN